MIDTSSDDSKLRPARVMSEDVVALAHAEILRLRENQSARLASVRSRTSGVLAASALAATLVSALGSNPAVTLAIIPYTLCAIYAVRAMRLAPTKVAHPLGVLGSLIDADTLKARSRIITEITREYDRTETHLGTLARLTKRAIYWFAGGIVMTLVVSLVYSLQTIGGST